MEKLTMQNFKSNLKPFIYYEAKNVDFSASMTDYVSKKLKKSTSSSIWVKCKLRRNGNFKVEISSHDNISVKETKDFYEAFDLAVDVFLQNEVKLAKKPLSKIKKGYKHNLKNMELKEE